MARREYPHLRVTATGKLGYRRGVPVKLRPSIGHREFKRAFGTRDRRLVPRLYALAHAACEQLFTEARQKLGVSEDTAYDMAMAALKRKGLLGLTDRMDISDAQDIVLNDAGFTAVDELSEAFEAYPESWRSVRDGIKEEWSADKEKAVMQKWAHRLYKEFGGGLYRNAHILAGALALLNDRLPLAMMNSEPWEKYSEDSEQNAQDNNDDSNDVTKEEPLQDGVEF